MTEHSENGTGAGWVWKFAIMAVPILVVVLTALLACAVSNRAEISRQGAIIDVMQDRIGRLEQRTERMIEHVAREEKATPR